MIKKQTKHYLSCEAPICQGDPNPNYKDEVIWYPGEKVCGKGPYEKFQKVQKEINGLVKQGRFKHKDEGFTARMLEKM